MAKRAPTLAAVVMAMIVSGYSSSPCPACELLAAGGAGAAALEQDAASPQPARPAIEPPLVFLSRGGPERTGSVSGSQLPEHPVVQWTTGLEGFPGEPLLAGGVIYVGDAQGTLYAIKLKDGSDPLEVCAGSQIFEAPAKRGGTIYLTTRSGLTALAEPGRMLWHCGRVGNATESSPLVLGDRIIVADSSGKVSAVDFDGQLIWQHDILADQPPSPVGFEADRATNSAARPRTAASDGTSIFQPIFDQSRIAVIDFKAGRRRWSFQAAGWIWGAPTVAEDRVFFGSQDKNVYCLDKRRKTPLWSFATKARIEAGVAYRDGSVYIGSCDGRFYRVNAETGKEVWSYQTPISQGANPAIYSAPLCTENAVYFGSFDGHLYCLKIDSGELKWRLKPVAGAEITGGPQTDGRRIVVAVRRNFEKQGQNAIIAIAEDQSQ